MAYLYFVIAVVSCLLLYLWKWQKLRSSLPPGPTPLPFLGNLKQINQADSRKSIVEWHKKYGPMFTVWMGTEPQIFVTGFELMKELFGKQGELFNDRQPLFVFEALTNGKFGILNTSGEQWREQRRFVLHTLRNFGFGRSVMEDKIKIEAEKLVETIEKRVNAATYLDEATFNVAGYLDSCVGNIIYSFVLGTTHAQDDQESPIIKIRTMLENSVRVIDSFTGKLLNSFPMLRFVPLFGHFGFDKIDESIQQLMSLLRAEVERHKVGLDYCSEPEDLTSAYLQEMHRRKKANEDMSYFNEWQLICIVEDLILAGLQTTMKTLSWSILFMMKYPDVQVKVQNEIDNVIKENRMASLSDRTQMPYTCATLQEVQRFANIIPFNFARTVKEAVTVGSYKLPKNISIVPQISAVLFDEHIFNDPSVFRPERYLDNNGSNFHKDEAVIPFSIGKRICLGETLARAELFMIFTSLFQKFKFSVPVNEAPPTLEPGPGFSLPPQSYNCFVQRRQQMNF